MIVLINPFEVPLELSDEAFLAGWQQAADYLRAQPGFVRSTLHRAVSPEPRFRFINVAEWESPEAFRAAVGSEAWAAIARQSASPGYPALYQVVRTIGDDVGHGGDAARQPAPAGARGES